MVKFRIKLILRNVLIQNASSVGALDLDFFKINKKNNFNFFSKLKNHEFSLLYLVGSDNLDFIRRDEFIIYQGSHGDRSAQIADIILPSPAFTEQDGLFINLEGRLQKSVKSSYPPGISKEDWKIFNLISSQMKGQNLFQNFQELRKNTLLKIKNHSDFDLLPKTKLDSREFLSSNLVDETINIKEIDYYFSNSIARSSKTMSDCRTIRSKNFKSKTGSY